MTSAGTSLIEDVVIENVLIDTRVRAGNWWGNGEPICIFALYHHIDSYRDPAPQRDRKVNINNVQLRNISCKGENIIGIIGKDENIQNVTIDGLYYERKPSQNSYIKGINTVDISPAKEMLPQLEDAPCYWLLAQGCKNVTIRNANVLPFDNQKLKAIVRDCTNMTISE